MSSHAIQIGARKLKVWPSRQALTPIAGSGIVLTDFPDLLPYHAQLTQRLLALRDDPSFAECIFRGGCGTKIRHMDRWGSLIAHLLQLRALELFRRAFDTHDAVIDSCWASVYGRGDYCMAHSHVRAVGSIVYLLEPGDPDPDDATAGKLCFVDPRITSCCQLEPDRMTHPLLPDLHAGTMVIFPAALVHCVNPYTGAAPRITLSWNIHTRALPGSSDAFGTSRLVR